MSSKSILIILSYTVSKFARSFSETQSIHNSFIKFTVFISCLLYRYLWSLIYWWT